MLKYIYESGLGEINEIQVQGTSVTLTGHRGISVVHLTDTKPRYAYCDAGPSELLSSSIEPIPGNLIYSLNKAGELFVFNVKEAFRGDITGCNCILLDE